MMRLWMGAVSALPRSDDVGRVVVDAVLGMTSIKTLSPHMPLISWGWLNERPVLPRGSPRLLHGTWKTAFRSSEGRRIRRVMTTYYLVGVRSFAARCIFGDGNSSTTSQSTRTSSNSIPPGPSDRTLRKTFERSVSGSGGGFVRVRFWLRRRCILRPRCPLRCLGFRKRWMRRGMSLNRS